jgi:predicted nucleic acid-binding protein
VVSDANILIRCVIGTRAVRLLTQYAGRIRFVTSELAWHEAETRLPSILRKRGIAAEPALARLASLRSLVDIVSLAALSAFERDARPRIDRRDPDDWHIVATAMAFGCPIWTEDYDFFGCGIPTWTTDRVEIYLGTTS